MKKLLQLFLTFLKIGAFTFGGGYAMISIMENEVVDKKKWIDREKMMEIISIAESTPGPVSLNTATYVGTRVAGFFGAAAATLGLVLPSFVIIIIVHALMERFKEIAAVQWVLGGIGAAVTILLFNAFWKFFKHMEKKWYAVVLFLVALSLAVSGIVQAVWVILGAGVLGALIASVIVCVTRKKQ